MNCRAALHFWGDLPHSNSAVLCISANFYIHPHECIGHPRETASHRHCLPDVASDGDKDQIEPANTSVRRVKVYPACAGHIDFRPRMRRSRSSGPNNVLTRVVEITRHNPCTETDTAHRLNGKDCEIRTSSSINHFSGALFIFELLSA